MWSLEVRHQISYLSGYGIPFSVTDVNTPGIHTATGYHYKEGTEGDGLAVDFAGTVSYWVNPGLATPQLAAITEVFRLVRPQLAEFLHPFNRADHRDHVHTAVQRGVFLPVKENSPIMPDDPNLPNITGPVEFHPIADSNGICQGYYIFSQKTGELHAFGPGARFYGRSEVVA